MTNAVTRTVRNAAWAIVLAGLLHSSPAETQRAKRRMPAVPAGNAGDWFPPDDYPPDAVRAGRAGRVVVDLGLDSAGKVVSCRVSQSSGTTSLDSKTCELALARGRFDPATDAKGRPTVSIYKLPVRWVLPDEEVGQRVVDIAKASSVVEIEFTIGTDGRVEACRMIARPDDTADLCLRTPVGTDWKTRYMTGGEPVRALVRQRLSVAVGHVKPVE